MCAEQSYGCPVSFVQGGLAGEIDPDRLHETERAPDLAGERLVPLACG
jgi:hypothetical protein